MPNFSEDSLPVIHQTRWQKYWPWTGSWTCIDGVGIVAIEPRLWTVGGEICPLSTGQLLAHSQQLLTSHCSVPRCHNWMLLRLRDYVSDQYCHLSSLLIIIRHPNCRLSVLHRLLSFSHFIQQCFSLHHLNVLHQRVVCIQSQWSLHQNYCLRICA